MSVQDWTRTHPHVGDGGWCNDELRPLLGTHLTPSGWTVRVRPDPKYPFRLALTASHGTRADKNLRVITVDRLTADALSTFDPEAHWRTR